MADTPEETIKEIAEGLDMLAQAAAQSAPDVAKQLQALQQQFMSIIEKAMGGQGGGGGAQPVQERGQGAPVGPQGVM
jgi:hypothetical protein